MLLTIFLWLVLLFNGALAVAFNKDSWLNILFKVMFFGIAVMAVVLLLMQYGFLVKA